MPGILIVDDEKSIRTSLKAFLLAEGYAVEVAGDAQEALRLLGERVFDVVVSDIVLPGINGIELLQAIRGAAPFAQVIMITGEPTVDTAAAALRAGAFDYLSKPVGKNAILRVVRNAAKVKAVDDERRRLAKDNRRYQRDLEKLVEERTRELRQSNTRLKGALDDLKDAQNEMIRHERLNALAQLAAGICHDFNNVLMPIRGLAEHLVSHPETLDDKEESLRLLGHILSASDDAKDVVRRMREFYRPREEADMAAVDVVRLFRDVTELTRPRWEAGAQTQGKTVTLQLQAEDVPPIAGDEAQLREALTNLVLNAVDAMPESGTVRLAAEPLARHVVLKVEDTGEGMPAEIRQRCLEPFFTTKGEQGTGMGLAMVHGIVNRHRGTLEIESQPGKGTTIALRLPVWSSGKVVREKPQRGGESTGKLRILVIDDEEWSRSLIARYLAGAGHLVETADGGKEGVAMAGATEFDLVITDRAMPEMGGDQVAACMKESVPHIPVLMLTGDIINTMEDTLAGVDAIVEKPVTQRELLDAMDGIVRMRESNGEQT